jgi:hypothetical protein
MNYAFVRFVKTTDGFVDKTSDSIAIATLNTASSVKDMFKLYTINPWLAANAPDETAFSS